MWNWLGFHDKDKALITLKKNFIQDEQYNIKKEEFKKYGSGGRNVNKYYLTVNTFKTLCIMANTQKALEIRKYYFKLEQIIFELIQEENKDFKEQLEKQMNNNLELKLNNKQLIKSNKLNHQNILLKQFGTVGSLIYLAIVKTFEDGTYVLKIGETRIGVQDLLNTVKTMKNVY